MESYAGLIKDRKIMYWKPGHADDKLCKKGIAFHVHPQTYTCAAVPSWRDMVYVSTRDFDINKHIIATRYGIWYIYPIKTMDEFQIKEIFEKFEGQWCTKYDHYKKQETRYRHIVDNYIKTAEKHGVKMEHFTYDSPILLKRLTKDSIKLMKNLAYTVLKEVK